MLVAELRQAVGEVEANSELGQRIAWATKYADRSDPLQVFRNRAGKTLTLYYYGYDYPLVKERGFQEPDLTSRWGGEKERPAVNLTEQPPRRTAYESALKVEPLEDVLPYEWAEESDWHWRVFRVPAAPLNRVLGLARRLPPASLASRGERTTRRSRPQTDPAVECYSIAKPPPPFPARDPDGGPHPGVGA
jgi:hypothetical protein